MNKKMKIEFNEQELQDIWSALTCWYDELNIPVNREGSEITRKEVKRLIAKVKKAVLYDTKRSEIRN